MKKIILFCIPYAGGSAMIYNQWKKYINESIELVPLELKGRGYRMNEMFCDSMSEMVHDLYSQILEKSEDREYAIFGHSMGSTITFELAHKIQMSNMKRPIHLLFSGRFPPEFSSYFKPIHKSSPDEFKKEIMSIGGTSTEIFDNKELSSIFIPIMRADYKILEEYEYVEYEHKLNCNISVFYGMKDERISNALLFRWLEYTRGETNFYSFDGGHFFILDCMEKVLETVNQILVNKQ